MEKACLLGILAYNSWRDIRTKEISVLANLLFCILGFCWGIYRGIPGPADLCKGAAIGAGIMLISALTGGMIGMGDGLLLIVTGCFLGIRENVLLFLLGLGTAGCFSAVLLLTKRAGRKTAIPFAPFLLLAYIGMVIT